MSSDVKRENSVPPGKKRKGNGGLDQDDVMSQVPHEEQLPSPTTQEPDATTELNESDARRDPADLTLSTGDRQGDDLKVSGGGGGGGGQVGGHVGGQRVPSRDDEAENRDGDDPNQDLLVRHSAGQLAFPDIPDALCVTVARMATGYESNPRRVRYLNRYGPRESAWYVWEDNHRGVDPTQLTDLPNVSNSDDRVLDHTVVKTASEQARVRTSDVLGVQSIIWDCGSLSGNPLAAAELLNPAVVKRTTEWGTKQLRREHRKELQNYPTTYVELRFVDTVKTWMHHNKRTKDSLTRSSNWELGSKYRALSKDPFSAETMVYTAALVQARKFVDWYTTIGGSIVPSSEVPATSILVPQVPLRTPGIKSERDVSEPATLTGAQVPSKVLLTKDEVAPQDTLNPAGQADVPMTGTSPVRAPSPSTARLEQMRDMVYRIWREDANNSAGDWEMFQMWCEAKDWGNKKGLPLDIDFLSRARRADGSL